MSVIPTLVVTGLSFEGEKVDAELLNIYVDVFDDEVCIFVPKVIPISDENFHRFLKKDSFEIDSIGGYSYLFPDVNLTRIFFRGAEHHLFLDFNIPDMSNCLTTKKRLILEMQWGPEITKRFIVEPNDWAICTKYPSTKYKELFAQWEDEDSRLAHQLKDFVI